MEFLLEYFLFFFKTATLVVAFILFLLFLVSLKSEAKQLQQGRIEFDDLNRQRKQVADDFSALLEAENKAKKKQHQKSSKQKDKEKENTKNKKGTSPFWAFWKKRAVSDEAKPKKAHLYVLEFEGDIAAQAVQNLRHEVSAILQLAKKDDEVLIKLKSPGGMVQGYGLAAAQLARLREEGVYLTVAVDEVAASGGYLMACVANKILAAPFAIVGSIGVVAQMPNFNRLLKKWDIDYEQFTAGDYKRTVTLFGENTDEGREKFKEELTEVHSAFKTFVHTYRPTMDIEKIATGEHWLASQAKEYGLVDELTTSDSYLVEKADTMNLYGVRYRKKSSLKKGLARFTSRLATRFTL